MGGYRYSHQAFQHLARMPANQYLARQVQAEGVVHIFETLSLVRLVSPFNVPEHGTGGELRWMINTICLPPPTAGLRGELLEFVGHEVPYPKIPDYYDVKRIRISKAKLMIDRTQTSLPDDSLVLRGTPVNRICNYGQDGSPLYSSVRQFGPADQKRAYLDALLVVDSGTDCKADPPEVLFRNVSVVGRRIGSVWE